jgi:hypothetical protein
MEIGKHYKSDFFFFLEKTRSHHCLWMPHSMHRSVARERPAQNLLEQGFSDFAAHNYLSVLVVGKCVF